MLSNGTEVSSSQLLVALGWGGVAICCCQKGLSKAELGAMGRMGSTLLFEALGLSPHLS